MAAASRAPAPGRRRRRRPARSSSPARSTVEPISTGVAELFKEANPDFNYQIEGPGTGDGFTRFCNGETDISDASRAIKDEEAATCAAAGIEYVELKIAYDGLTVMTNVDNTAIACLSFADLYALVGPESTGFDKWSDGAAIAKELGSNTALPDADLVITGPGEESGTYDSFVELVLAKIAEARGQEAQTTRPDYTELAPTTTSSSRASPATRPRSAGSASPSPRRTRTRSARSRSARTPTGPASSPTAETVSDGSYPISRPLFIYVNKAKAAANPAVADYVDFYLAEGTIAKVLETVPYVNLPADGARRHAGRLGSRASRSPPARRRPGRLGGPAGVAASR